MSIPVGLLPRLFFPYKKISEVPVNQIQQALIQIFEKRGKPDWIKVDNGRPFGDPQLELIPVLALWLLCYNIKVIWNPPATPKANAKVERSQGVLATWVEPQKCSSTQQLQKRLLEEADFYNYHFPIRRLNKRTRIEVFPDFDKIKNPWDSDDFNIKRALTFLQQGTWERKVSQNGQISIYSQRFSVGTKFKHQVVSIKLNTDENQWNIFDANSKLIKAKATLFSKENIQKLDLA